MSTIETGNEANPTDINLEVETGSLPVETPEPEPEGFDIVIAGEDEKPKQDPATNAKYAAQRLERKRLRELEQTLAAVKRGELPETLRVTPESPDQPPSIDDYFSDAALEKYGFDTARAQAAFQAALGVWQVKATQEHTGFAAKQAQKVQEYEAKSIEQTQAINRHYDSAEKLNLPDYQEKEDALAAMTAPDVVTGIMQLFPEKSAAIIYHLGSNPELTKRLNALPSQQAMIELGRLDAKLTLKPRGKAVSAAPMPDEPLNGQATAANLASLQKKMEEAADKGDVETYRKLKNQLKGVK
ncbi:scaffolding protein [Serratia sp. UGAL515B_01]|uniref:scaffolding protein n=1 Tax=Serratia sp. UGAL515B_01 TaxID=2986763 RepID=UPI00295557BC|nr:scaffolding protein [Serratia sp. UGAL515B_01]WON77576.1 scaffolding protein [Serratia sp. UGAL515B_01]